jgi:hypothetical protein
VKTSYVESYDLEKNANVQDCWTGVKANLRSHLSDDRASVSIDLEGSWSRLLGMARVKEPEGERQLPEIANHLVRASATLPVGRWVLLGRLSDTKLVEGKPDLVVLGRFTPGGAK